jgi:hypothetical protein
MRNLPKTPIIFQVYSPKSYSLAFWGWGPFWYQLAKLIIHKALHWPELRPQTRVSGLRLKFTNAVRVVTRDFGRKSKLKFWSSYVHRIGRNEIKIIAKTKEKKRGRLIPDKNFKKRNKPCDRHCNDSHCVRTATCRQQPSHETKARQLDRFEPFNTKQCLLNVRLL